MDIDKLAFTEDEIKKKMKSNSNLKNVYDAAVAAEKMKDWEIGMVIVRRSVRSGELCKNKAGVPEKYIVVNKLGPLPICKKLMVNGRPGTGLYCPAVDEGEDYSFEEDPEVADSTLLGFDYDPLEFPKKAAKARDRARRHNDNILLINAYDPDQRYDDLKDFLKKKIEDDGQFMVWRLKNQNDKEQIALIKVHEADPNRSYGDRIETSTGEKLRFWELTAKYSGRGYYISEPRTLKEELEKLR